MTQYGFYFDSTRCTGCKTCEMACKDYKDLPATIAFRKVYDYEGGSWTDAGNGVYTTDTFAYHVSLACNHCAMPACMAKCPSGAIEKDGKTMDRMRQDVMRDLSYMTYAPIVFISALTGQRVGRLFELIRYVNDQAAMRITTGMLNNVLADATARVQPPTDKGRRLKIYYMTQVGIKPPHFVCFCNDARLFHFSYQRYLENQIRSTFGLEGTPVRLTVRQKGEKEE